MKLTDISLIACNDKKRAQLEFLMAMDKSIQNRVNLICMDDLDTYKRFTDETGEELIEISMNEIML